MNEGRSAISDLNIVGTTRGSRYAMKLWTFNSWSAEIIPHETPDAA